MGNKRKSRQSSDKSGDQDNGNKLFKPRGPSEESESLVVSDTLNETNNVL
jgi:hypothetical protein